jgi:tRNA-dihydrouridine synthase A
MLGLFNGLPGARRWRRHLSEIAHRPGAGIEVIEEALTEVVTPRPQTPLPGKSREGHVTRTSEGVVRF